ncbi:MAG: hypothetical protein DRH08_04600 [Deltaproteobacteria bacterium]|nr:MAG: hypothetical protein DRH08_04600 [Deltaproteobacteria bacterium]
MSEKCPACGSIKVYNSGFTIECATRDCSNYTPKQDLAVSVAGTQQLKEEFLNTDFSSEFLREDIRVLIVGSIKEAEYQAAQARGPSSDLIKYIIKDVDFHNARISTLMGQLVNYPDEPKEEDELLEEPDDFLDDYPFRTSNWLRVTDDIKVKFLQSAGIPAEKMGEVHASSSGDAPFARCTYKEPDQKCAAAKRQAKRTQIMMETFKRIYGAQSYTLEEMAGLTARFTERAAEDVRDLAKADLRNLWDDPNPPTDIAINKDVSRHGSKRSLHKEPLSRLGDAVSLAKDLRGRERNRKSTLSLRGPGNGETYTTGPVRYLGTIKQQNKLVPLQQNKLVPLQRKRLGPGRYSAQLYPVGMVPSGPTGSGDKPNHNGDVFPAITHDHVTALSFDSRYIKWPKQLFREDFLNEFSPPPADNRWKGILSEMSDDILNDIATEVWPTFEVPVTAELPVDTKWPQVFHFLSDKTKMNYMCHDDKDSPRECPACALGATGTPVPGAEEKVPLGQSSDVWKTVYGMDPGNKTSLVTMRGRGAPIGKGGELTISAGTAGSTVKEVRITAGTGGFSMGCSVSTRYDKGCSIRRKGESK